MRMDESETYQLVVLFRKGSETPKVLLECDSEGKLSLPELTIPKWQRVAEQLTSRVKDSWNLDAVCLFDPVWEAKPMLDKHCNYQVLDSCDAQWIPPTNCALLRTTSIRKDSFVSPEQWRVLECSLDLLDAYNSGTLQGPFAENGWLDRLRAWVQEQLGQRGLRLTSRQQQLNSGPQFSLIRFETADDSAVWFKAVGEPFLREYFVTVGLAQDYPRYFPPLLGIHPEWHGWLTSEVTSQLLLDADDIGSWRNVVETLTDLQVELVEREKYLLDLGCTDWRIDQITCRIDSFLTAMEEIMQLQPKTPPPSLSKCELDELGETLKSACQRLEVLGIPNTYVHGDFGPHNILSSGGQCSFIDLAESGVGHPLLTFQYLLDCLHKSHPEFDATHCDLRRAYGARWRSLVSERDMTEAFKCIPLVTLLWHAMSGYRSQAAEAHINPDRAKYLRGLVRRMKVRAAELDCTVAA